jgi:CRISPR/Cas system CSM-associated protein Csm3 (group 7 of RAMP superfamily)
MSDLNQEGVSENSTQHTQFSPVKPGISFTFRIYFENLSKEELGLLAWVLMLPGRDGVEYRHKLGMAKPFGMGTVKLEPQLFLVERPVRYSRLFSDTGWALGESDESERLESLFLDFEQALMQEIGEQHQRLYSVERIKELLALLEWHEDDPGAEEKRYMQTENEYRERPVLPTPATVANKIGRIIRQQTKQERTLQSGSEIRGKVNGVVTPKSWTQKCLCLF